MSNRRRVHFTTLGCPKNQIDTELMLGTLVGEGHEIVLDPGEADVLVVNTCSFIEASKVESIDAILDLAQVKEATGSRLVVAGCLSQRYASELQKELPEVDAFVGTGQLGAIREAVVAPKTGSAPLVYVGAGHTIAELDRPRVVMGTFFSAYLKISEGCSRRCSFCIIPSIRGRQESRPIGQLVAEAERLASQGVVELNLVAQDLTSYGRDRGGETLTELLRALVRVDGLRWLRLLYAYPQYVTDDLLDVIAGEPKICPYLDMPMQHANDRILRAMHRERSGNSLRSLIDRIRRRVPGVVLRSSFIVGFPGETDAEFEDLLSFVREMAIDHVGVFRYSREEGTRAAALPDQVPEVTKRARYRRLMEAQSAIALQRNRSRLGGVEDVLVCESLETRASAGGASFLGGAGKATGRGRGEAPDIDGIVVLDQEVEPGEIVRVRVTEAGPYDVFGTRLTDERVDRAIGSL